MIFSISIGVFYSKVADYLSILGGFGGVSIAFLFPTLLYLKCNDNPTFHWKNVLIVISVSIVAGIGYTGGMISLINVVKNLMKGE